MSQLSQIKDRTVTALIDIGQILADNHNLKVAMSQVIERLGRHHGIVRGVVMLLNRETEELRVEASHGLSESRAKAITYHLGEGITGRVAQSGKPIAVPQISRELIFPDHPGPRKKGAGAQELSFVCVPVIVNKKTAGVLGVDMYY
ncbi:MAG: GAF domain-containing protein, partial [Pyrinomonadaceae bacterium]